jgi:purine-binding chemotaxis protein CheW
MDEQDSYVLFELAGGTYGVRSVDIQQLEMVTSITPVPNAPPYVSGVISVRGQVVPVVDLRVRFAFDRIAPGTKTRLLIVKSAERRVALMVDSAREFARIEESVIEPPPTAVSGLSGRYLRGLATVNEHLVLILDIEELLDAQFDIEMASLEDSHSDQEQVT